MPPADFTPGVPCWADLAAPDIARVTVPPIDLPVGRFAVLTDPNGAHFAVIRLSTQ